MTSISCSEIAQQLLNQAVAGDFPSELPASLLTEPCGQALFSVLAEGLSDRFEPSLCDVYARLFSQAIASVMPGMNAGELVARYQRIRTPRLVSGDPQSVFVLSRVTLGADIAVTSVLLDAAKRRFPNAEIIFVGPRKNYELFAGDRRIQHAAISYRRGSLTERLSLRDELAALLRAPDSLTLDSDSRLTQLGLLPVCDESRYHLFESRSYGGTTDRPLPELAAAWAAETLGVTGARPFIALPGTPEFTVDIAVSLGVGENPAKRLPDPFEEQLLSLLAERGGTLCIDRGAGGEESARVARAVERSGIRATFWDGSFAGFAAIVAASKLYVGYDSAGQHVAAAAGIPLITIFAGFPVPRMFDRWRPVGAPSSVIRVDTPDIAAILARIRAVQR